MGAMRAGMQAVWLNRGMSWAATDQ
ncbi:MAG: hypothetical protein ACLP6Z_05610 [Steroidobacteraceae bacterium]